MALRILALESRRAAEMAQLIRINGGEPVVAPALVEVPLERNEPAFAFAERLFGGGFDMAVFLTGVGARLLSDILATRYPRERLPEALRSLTVVARGPKPMAVLREWQVPVGVAVPEPNTWRELLEAVEPRSERRVAVQEYGRMNPELTDGLQTQGREVTTVPVYQWELPADTGPLRRAARSLAQGDFDAVLFTTSVQLAHLLRVATDERLEAATLIALRNTFVASIGPTCTEALREKGVEPSLEPSRPKMGVLVQEALSALRERG